MSKKKTKKPALTEWRFGIAAELIFSIEAETCEEAKAQADKLIHDLGGGGFSAAIEDKFVARVYPDTSFEAELLDQHEIKPDDA